MPYSSISSAPPSWRRLASQSGGASKIPLTLAQINYIARVYDGLTSRGRSKTQAAAMAVGNFRSVHNVVNGHWIKKHDDIEYGETKKCDVPFDSPFSITKHYVEGEADEEKWYVEGIAVIDKMDYQDDVVSPEAMRTAIDDLSKNSTVLHNHDSNQEAGVVEAYSFLGDSIFIKVLVSKTRPDLWTKIQEGTLRKFSIRGRVLAFDIRYVPALNKAIRYIKAMTINEVSLVSVSAQAEAEAFRWYISKQDQPLPYHIEKAFRSLRGGDSDMAKKARIKKQAPSFSIAKNDKGQQVITLALPEEIQKSGEVSDLDLDDIEKAVVAAQGKLDEIIAAATEALKSEDETVKTWAGKVLEAAKALKDSKIVPEEKGGKDTHKGDEGKGGDEETPGTKQTIEIVLPESINTQKKEGDDNGKGGEGDGKDALKVTAEDLAKADFQKCIMTKMSGEDGLDMQKAADACKAEMVKATEAAAGDNGMVKMLLERLMQKDNVNTTLQTAVSLIAETVGKQTDAINVLTEKVQSIPIRKGLTLTKEQIESDKDKLKKELDGKEPMEQLRFLLDRTINADTKTT